jgi:putative SOS response-associated peptidase YedK
LILADGFYEWQLSGRSRTPFRFTMNDKSFFCMARLWERWIKPPARGEFEYNDLDETPPSRVIETFSIITTMANPMVAAIHERMPVILHPSHWQWWIDDRRRGEDVKYLLRQFDSGDMDCYRVSPLVNNAKNDSPECLTPA